MKHHYKNTKAFTLAEVLITLGIIGVVAALTLPSVITNYQKQATATSVKKAYSQLGQVIEMAKVDYGDPSGWNYYEVDNIDKWAQTYFEPYMKVINSGTCTNNSSQNCMGMAYIRRLDSVLSSSVGNPIVPPYIIITGGEPFAYAFIRNGTNSSILAYVNKPKKYAIIGRDVFPFAFDKTVDNPKLISRYIDNKRDDLLAPGTMQGNSCNRISGSGYACTAVIMLDGWKISKDYPWR